MVELILAVIGAVAAGVCVTYAILGLIAAVLFSQAMKGGPKRKRRRIRWG